MLLPVLSFVTFAMVLAIGSLLIRHKIRVREPFSTNSTDPSYRKEKDYQTQVALLNRLYEPYASRKRPIREFIEKDKSPPADHMFVNYEALTCRFPGYIGPAKYGYMDPAIGIKAAIDAGVRSFVFDIDYVESCVDDTVGYFPRLIVRDIQGKLQINEATKQLCQSPAKFELKTIFQLLEQHAFAPATPQATDPLLITLFFHRHPPGSYKSKATLDYYSYVARALRPLKNRLVMNELEGGKLYRHQQEGKLLTQPILNYEGRVILATNADTSGFTEMTTYAAEDDLDFLTHLRLFSTQTKPGITQAPNQAAFGALQTTEDFMAIPPDRSDQTMQETQLRYTTCLHPDPLKQPTEETYQKCTSYGVHSVPFLLFDESNQFLFTDKTFKTYGFRLKPEALRYRKPPVVIPGKPNPSMNANQGRLQMPSI